MYACMHTYIQTCIHTYIHTYIHTHIHTYIVHTYVHNVHRYVYTYILYHHTSLCVGVWVWYVANEGYNRSTDQSLRHFDLTIFLMWYKLNVHSMNVNPAAAISLTTPTTAYTHAVRYVCTPAIELKHHCTVLRMYTPMNDASFPG